MTDMFHFSTLQSGKKKFLLDLVLCVGKKVDFTKSLRPNVAVKFRKFLSVEITEIYSHAFWQKFRESNAFTKLITKELI